MLFRGGNPCGRSSAPLNTGLFRPSRPTVSDANVDGSSSVFCRVTRASPPVRDSVHRLGKGRGPVGSRRHGHRHSGQRQSGGVHRRCRPVRIGFGARCLEHPGRDVRVYNRASPSHRRQPADHPALDPGNAAHRAGAGPIALGATSPQRTSRGTGHRAAHRQFRRRSRVSERPGQSHRRWPTGAGRCGRERSVRRFVRRFERRGRGRLAGKRQHQRRPGAIER